MQKPDTISDKLWASMSEDEKVSVVAHEELHKLALDLWNMMAEADKDAILGGE